MSFIPQLKNNHSVIIPSIISARRTERRGTPRRPPAASTFNTSSANKIALRSSTAMVANQSVDAAHDNETIYCAPPPAHAYGEFYATGDSQFYMHGGPNANEIGHTHVCAVHRDYGPVTVPMVSTNASPPIAMPVTVPAGHVVQQIVDESGTLRHVILSPQHPAGLVSIPTQNYGNDSSGNNPAARTQQVYQTIHPNYPPQHLLAQTQIPNSGPRLPSPTPTPPPPSQPTYLKDERAQRQHYKLKKKWYDKQQTSVGKGTPNNNDAKGHKDGKNKNQDQHAIVNNQHNSKVSNSVETSEDGDDGASSIQDDEDSVKLITEILSSVEAPLVLDLGPRSALLQWAPPTRLSEPPSDNDITSSVDVFLPNQSDLVYEVLLSDKSKEMRFKSIYRGASLSCRIQDLKPGQEYSVCVQVHYGELQGSATDPIVKFVTPSCEPDKPAAPKLFNRTKNSIQVRWNAVNDNGSPIQNYIVECDDGNQGDFAEIYKGKTKQHTLTKLRPSTAYRLRIAAVNEVGKSPYSEIAVFCTADNPPPQPHPPTLVEATPNSLHLKWTKSRSREDEFQLQLDDPRNAYGYLNVYNGPETHYQCNQLHYFTNYKFRLRSSNESGYSSWSTEVQYATLADRPSAPSKPQVKGRIQAYSFKLRWDPPAHLGGAEIDTYQLELNSGSGYRLIYQGKENETICDKLTPGTTYQLRVSCTTIGGMSSYSDPCTVTTDAIIPGQCSIPALMGKPKADQIVLKWQEPDYNGGAPVLEYEVEMTCPDGSKRTIHKQKSVLAVATDLKPGRKYIFKVRAINRIGVSPWSDELTALSGAAPPEAPNAPNLNVKSSNSVHVDWLEPANNGAPITEYRLEIDRVPSVDQTVSDSFETAYEGLETSHEVKNLNPATGYRFRVRASNSAGSSNFSPVSSIETPSAAPSTVSILKHSMTPTTIKLHWNEPINNGSPILRYNIEVGDKLIVTEEPVTEYEIAKLQSNTTYKVRVQAVNAIGEGPFSATLKVTTLKFPPSPPKLQCIGVGHNYLKLKWGDGKNNDYTQYCVEVMNPRYKEFQCVYKGTAFTCKVNKLQEMTAYKFRINASNDVGCGEYSAEYEFKTNISPPSILKLPKVTDIEDGCCTLEWAPGKNSFSDPLLYEVQLCENNESFNRVYCGPETKCQLKNLNEDVRYGVRVCSIRVAATGELEGPFSSIVNFTVPSKKPMPELKLAAATAQTSIPAHKNRTVLHLVRHKFNIKTMSERQRILIYAMFLTVVSILIAFVSVMLYDYIVGNV